MRFYYSLCEFFRAVEERIENGKTNPPTLYRATAKLDKDFEENDDSVLWPLEKRYGKKGYQPDGSFIDPQIFNTYEEAQGALLDHFNEAVAERVYNL